MEALEARISYTFRNPRLLAEALTHPSLAYETQGPHFPQLDEGRLTKLRSQLVSRTALERYALRIDLGAYLLMGKGEASSGGRERSSTLADAVEALVGAIYMDSDIDATTTVVMHLCHEEISSLDLNHEHLNPKGRLQEIIQATGAPSPRYEMLDQRGPDHRKEFVSRVFWQNEPLGVGQGSSKKHAEADAARNALNHPMVVALLVKNPALDPNSSTRPLLSEP